MATQMIATASEMKRNLCGRVSERSSAETSGKESETGRGRVEMRVIPVHVQTLAQHMMTSDVTITS